MFLLRQINYKKLWIMLLEKEVSKKEFRKSCNISTGTMTKLNKNIEVSMSVLIKICNTYNCDISDICETTITN